jgi:uncharacterized membrane protein YuzA (DUF378 family)
MVFALIVPVFGITQMQILVGDFHTLIRVAHLLVGAAAVILTERSGQSLLKRSLCIHQRLMSAQR